MKNVFGLLAYACSKCLMAGHTYLPCLVISLSYYNIQYGNSPLVKVTTSNQTMFGGFAIILKVIGPFFVAHRGAINLKRALSFERTHFGRL